MLHLFAGLLCCPAERWQLDVRTEGLTLQGLRTQLAAIYEVCMWRAAYACRMRKQEISVGIPVMLTN